MPLANGFRLCVFTVSTILPSFAKTDCLVKPELYFLAEEEEEACDACPLNNNNNNNKFIIMFHDGLGLGLGLYASELAPYTVLIELC